MNQAADVQVTGFSTVGTAAIMWFMNNFSMFKSGANFTFK